MKVLIADDDVDGADSLAILVRVVLHFDVCVMYDGEGAIATAGDYRPDAVVLDINMPGLDGSDGAQTQDGPPPGAQTVYRAHGSHRSVDPANRPRCRVRMCHRKGRSGIGVDAHRPPCTTIQGPIFGSARLFSAHRRLSGASRASF
jgi:hypothetical protein